jgi:hypothetical protein
MIAVQASARHRAEYRRLLKSEWKGNFPHDVLNLLWSLVQSRKPANDVPLLKLLNPGSNSEFPARFYQALLQRIHGATKFIPLPAMPPWPQKYDPSSRLSKVSWQAARFSTYLTLQAHAKISGDRPFLLDVQVMAFQAAAHLVLPALQEKHPDDHAILLHVLALFPLEYYPFDPSHFCYLTSIIYGYLGRVEQRLRLLHASFRLTPPDDHSYLTKAQEYWSELLDHKRYAKAEEFLLGLPLKSLSGHQEEVREMIVDGLKIIQAEKATAL